MRVRFARPVACLMITSALLSIAPQPPAARADATPVASEDYRPLLEKAVKAYDRQNFLEARKYFTEANALFPNARAQRGLGMSEFALRNYERSAAALDAALDSPIKPLTGILRADTEQMRDEARALATRASGDAATAAVPAARAPGLPPVQTSLASAGPLEATSFAPSGAPARSDAAPARPLRRNPWLWTGVGVVIAAAATGLALGLERRGDPAEPVANPWATARLR